MAGKQLPVADKAESRTRQRVLQTVSEQGPITAAAVAERLGLTTAAVRRHLDCLADSALVEERETVAVGARKRGRPARSYVVSARGHEALRDDYATLATSVLDFLHAHGGDEAVHAFARQRADALGARLAADVSAAGPDVEDRSRALATALTREGYAASTRPVGGGTPLAGVQLCQGHCPVQHVAEAYPQFCEAEAEMFSEVLGVHVQRLASLAHGDHVCTTFVPDHPTTPIHRKDPR
ncbi:transcriptional regulator [Calidifontibacter sp. DB0510]|uniref:Transcriptional regulator n=1 Tax=Metallococcus carri TaxID=1656884 RepID=A0A967B0A8_9MICO|nr:metalloregulator ArsR/SmtB family transcription factor [Metallococcus carri]NHN54895.1 transcriptional regulator [Metallococcus carri]NOP37240.1 transcriptional regulator [Calidifontibacter sp. DB2511S]